VNWMERRRFLKGLAGCAVSLAACSRVGRNSSDKPNVILIMTDDQGYGDLSCHGNPHIRTANLDALHSQSTRLTNFHVSPSCAPSRGALLTGRYTNRVGSWRTTNGRNLMFKDEVTVGDVFAANGYRTGLFGKWHLGDTYPYRAIDRGFHEVWTYSGGGVGTSPDYWDNDCFDDTYSHNGKYEMVPGYGTDVFFNKAIEFIEENRRQPFFCHIPTRSPHGPYFVPEKYRKLFEGNDNISPYYYGLLANIDENVGRLLRRVSELGLENHTIVIFTTDNGATTWKRKKVFNAGMRGYKGSVYEGGHRVPLFIRWPAGGVQPGKEVARLTAHIDLLPTLIELCRLKPPADIAFDGRSLAPLLTGTGEGWPDRTLFVDQQSSLYLRQGRYAAMTDRWRLINGESLYDMRADPGQTRNVAGEHPEVVKRLREAYEEWFTDVSAHSRRLCELTIGSDRQNPYKLTCYDWPDPGPSQMWHQRHIREAPLVNGFWPVEVERDGLYEFRLRRWPEEVNKPITASLPELTPETDHCGRSPAGVAIHPVKARLVIADFDRTKPVEPEAQSVDFEVPLKAGRVELRTWFFEANGDSRGAYYVYVTRLAAG